MAGRDSPTPSSSSTARNVAHSKGISVFYSNVRSIQQTTTAKKTKQDKLANFKKIITESTPDVICMTETWLQVRKVDALNLELEYQVHRQDREARDKTGRVKRGGGVLIAFKKSRFPQLPKILDQESITLTDKNDTTAEIIIASVVSQDNTINFVVIYDPTHGLHERYRMKLAPLLKKTYEIPDAMNILLGDINLETLAYKEEGCPQQDPEQIQNCFALLNPPDIFQDCRESFSSGKPGRNQQNTFKILSNSGQLENLMKCYTREEPGKKPAILDLLLTDQPNRVSNIKEKGAITDHICYEFEIAVPAPAPVPVPADAQGENLQRKKAKISLPEKIVIGGGIFLFLGSAVLLLKSLANRK